MTGAGNFPEAGRGGGERRLHGIPPVSNDGGLITLIISIAAVIFSLGTLISDVIRNRNLLIHDLQIDGQIFHQTLIRLDRLHCSPVPDQEALTVGKCSEVSFFIPTSNSRGREILLQRAESLERRIEILLKKLDMREFGYLTPVDYRTLAKEEIRDMNFEKARVYIDKEVEEISSFRGHSGFVLRLIHADLMNGWYQEILEGKKRGGLAGARYFDRALARAESQISILPVRNYTVIFILQQKGCARWIGRSLFYSGTKGAEEIKAFRVSRKILENEPKSVKLLQPLRDNAVILDSGKREEILSTCQDLFEQI